MADRQFIALVGVLLVVAIAPSRAGAGRAAGDAQDAVRAQHPAHRPLQERARYVHAADIVVE